MTTETTTRLRDFIFAGQCPICLNGKSYRCLANHTQPKHNISGFQLREMAGLNITTSICDPSYSALRSDIQKGIKNLAFERFDRHQLGKKRANTWGREEARATRLAVARSPEHIAVFKEAMSKVDRKAVAQATPIETRRERSRKGGMAILAKRGREYYRLMGLKGNRRRAVLV